MDVLNELNSKIEAELEKIIKKNDITPTELENATKAVCLMEKILQYQYMDQNGYDEYSDAERYYSDRYPYYDDNRSNGPRMSARMSSARGRDPMNGRYVSRDSSYNRRYSGHSIKDRMVDRLESMMDDAQTDYEKSLITQWIERIEKDS